MSLHVSYTTLQQVVLYVEMLRPLEYPTLLPPPPKSGNPLQLHEGQDVSLALTLSHTMGLNYRLALGENRRNEAYLCAQMARSYKA